jgi:hypothetical protein
MNQETTKQKYGKHGNRRALHVWITAWHDYELDRIAKIVGKSRGDVVDDALQIYINKMYDANLLIKEE